MERTFSDEGIVLARRNWGEADRILSVFTKHRGRLSIIAKSVRRPKSRKRGHLEIFSYVRFQAVSGRSLDLMTEAEVIDSFSQVRKNLKKVSLAYYFMEVLGRTTHENEVHADLFELTIEYLNRLKSQKQLKKLRLDFVLALLTLLGFWPKGKPLANPDYKLEEVIERQIASFRVGKRMLE